MQRAIITSASNKFFPSLVNMLGSIAVNYPNHPDVYVYDLGLSSSFKNELRSIEWVHVLDIPHFVPHWRACYTWKTYIFVTPLAELNLYIDAGTQILRPLDEMFDGIEKDGYFAVHQGVKNDVIVPRDYTQTFNIDESILNDFSLTAGIFGFKKDGKLTSQLQDMFDAAKQGYCLGFSKGELWKNKGVNKTEYVRDCEMFRHDTTLLSIFTRKNNPDFHAHEGRIYAGWDSPEDHSNQAIWNVRMNYTKLDYLNPSTLHKKISFVAFLNRVYINTFLILKQIRLKIKNLIK